MFFKAAPFVWIVNPSAKSAMAYSFAGIIPALLNSFPAIGRGMRLEVFIETFMPYSAIVHHIAGGRRRGVHGAAIPSFNLWQAEL
jgi:hypothetical protein